MSSTLLERKKSTSKGSSDDFQTPTHATQLLIDTLLKEKAINKNMKVWEPAMGEGKIIGCLEANGFECFGTDVKNAENLHDFLKTEVGGYPTFDLLITNPPFSLKDKFLQKCFELKKPFALLLPITALGEQGRGKMYREHGVQAIFPPERINFHTPSGTGSGAWFYSIWITNGFNLKRDLTFA